MQEEERKMFRQNQNNKYHKFKHLKRKRHQNKIVVRKIHINTPQPKILT